MFGVERGLGEGGEAQEWCVPPPGLSSPGVPPADLLQPGVPEMHPDQQWVFGGPSSFPVQVQLDFLPSIVPTFHSPQLDHLFFNAVNQVGGHEREHFNYSFFHTSPSVPPAGLLQPGVAHIHPQQQQLDRPMFLPRHQHGVLRVQQDPLPSIDHTKPRMKWTPELHDLFVNAVNRLGGLAKAKPKAISNIMRVHGLTLDHIKSHLQKHRYDVVLGRKAAARRAAEQALGEEAQGPEANPAVPPARENEVTNEEAVEEKDELDEELKDDKIEEHVGRWLDAEDRYLKLLLNSAQRAAGNINPRGSLSQNEPLHFSSELEQYNLRPTTHSREMVRAHTSSSSQPQEFAQNNGWGVGHSSTSTANAGEEWDEVVQGLEVDPVYIYLNFQDDAAEGTNI